MKNIDIHGYDRQLELVIARIKNSQISEANKKAILKFADDCSANGLSKPRIIFYLNRLLIAAKLLKKDFAKAKKEDIKRLINKINEANYTENTKKDFKVSVKKFYQWLRKIEEKGIYPEEVKWIPTTVKNNNHILPEELLTEEEINKMIEKADHPRDKALIATLADSGCRIGELLSLKIKHLTFDEHSAILIVSGKTGMRRVRVIGATPYLASWKNTHPDKNDPEAPLWIVKGTTKKIAQNKNREGYKLNWSYNLNYRAATEMIKEVARKAEITKRVNPHSFRHSRATFLASRLTEAQLKEHFGWTQASGMASVYVHLSGRDSDDALLKIYGKKEKNEIEESKFKPRKCPRCETENGATTRFCSRCGLPLELETALEIEEKRKKSDEIMTQILTSPKVQKIILERIMSQKLGRKLMEVFK